MPDEKLKADLHRIYLDTNVLLRGQGWPVPSIVLNNLLRLAELCGIERVLPDPVLKEAEEHWLRDLKDSASRLSNAQRDLHRVASPIPCDVTVQHPPVDQLLEEYRKRVSDAVVKYNTTRVPFTHRTVEEVFGFATRYLQPFAPKGEGKGFQDAVILLSVLDHLNSSPDTNGVFVTADNDFAGVGFDSLVPAFDPARLRVMNLEMTFDLLSKRYYEESVIKPYQQENRNALTAAEGMSSEITEFVGSRVTIDMIKASKWGGTIKALLALEGVTILSVDTPLPEPNSPNRPVEILIKVMALYRVSMAGGIRSKGGQSTLSALLNLDNLEFLAPSEEHETFAFWNGGIQARADVVDREFKHITLVGLVAEETSLPEPNTSLRARGSAEFWMTRQIEEDIVEKTRIPPGATPDNNQVAESETPDKHV